MIDSGEIININLERIRMQKNELDKYAESIEKYICNIRISIMQLLWTGKKYDKFIKLYNDEISNLENILDYIKKIPEVLDISEKIYRNADEKMERYSIGTIDRKTTKINEILRNLATKEITFDEQNVENVKNGLININKELKNDLIHIGNLINNISIVDRNLCQILIKNFNTIKEYLTNFMKKIIALLEEALETYKKVENINKKG